MILVFVEIDLEGSALEVSLEAVTFARALSAAGNGVPVDALRATQSLAFLPYFLGLLCDAHIKAGQPSEAMKAVKEAISLVETTGERFYSAELYRLHGELLARASISQCEEAKAEFNRAVKIAAQQGAVSLERKARDSLRRLFG